MFLSYMIQQNNFFNMTNKVTLILNDFMNDKLKNIIKLIYDLISCVFPKEMNFYHFCKLLDTRIQKCCGQKEYVYKKSWETTKGKFHYFYKKVHFANFIKGKVLRPLKMAQKKHQFYNNTLIRLIITILDKFI